MRNQAIDRHRHCEPKAKQSYIGIASLTKVARNDEILPRVKLSPKSRFLVFMIFWFLVSGYFSYAEDTLTISTYYPTPYGVYNVLTLYPQSDIKPDDIVACGQNNEGEMVYYQDADPQKSQIIVCKRIDSIGGYAWKDLVAGGGGGEGFWKQENNNPYPQKQAWGLSLIKPQTYFKGKLHVGASIFRQGDNFFAGESSTAHNLGINSTTGDHWSGIYGGEGNQVSSFNSVIAGGQDNLIGNTEEAAFIAGGRNNRIGDDSFEFSQGGRITGIIWGGQDNTILSWPSANQGSEVNVISGGWNNLGGGSYFVIAGGQGNIASFIPSILNTPTSWWTVVSGGQSNQAIADYSTVTGGRNNRAEGRYSLVSGGEANQARGDYSWAGGRNMVLTPAADRTFAWGHSTTPLTPPIATPDAFIIYSDATTFTAQIGNPSTASPLPVTDLRIYNLPQGSGDNLLYDSSTGQISRPVSSIRYKTNIRPIENALAKVKQLRGVYFNWKETGKPALGMIAEEVGKVIAEVVSYEANGQDARSLAYDKLVALLVEAVKEQEKRIADLRKGVDVLKK